MRLANRLNGFRTCSSRCGSLPVSVGDGKCGLAMMMVANASSETCFSKAINVDPQGRTPVEKPIRSYKPLGCFEGELTLTAGFADEPDMTIGTCIGLAQGMRYIGLANRT